MRPLAVLCLLLVIPPAEASDQLRQDVQRIFGGDALNGKSFGPEAGEIIEYETATGKRLPSSRQRNWHRPGPKSRWTSKTTGGDSEMRHLLVFTETKKYWRTNSLGDYWVLTRESGSLKKLGGAATPASSLMYATCSPAISRAPARAGPR